MIINTSNMAEINSKTTVDSLEGSQSSPNRGWFENNLKFLDNLNEWYLDDLHPKNSQHPDGALILEVQPILGPIGCLVC